MPGYSVNLKEDGADFGYLCTSCGLLLREPKQTPCGHRYCQSCVQELTRSWGGRCGASECGEEVQPSELWPDKAAEREVLGIAILCNKEEDGCKWEGVVRHLMAHLSECDFEKISCVNAGQGCKAAVSRKNLANHLQSDCDYRPVTCQWCEETTPYKELKAHKRTCPSAPVQCDWCSKKGLTRAQLQEHQHPETGNCPNMKIACSFELMGCKERMEKRHRIERERTNVEELRRKSAAWETRVGTFEGIVAVSNNQRRDTEVLSDSIGDMEGIDSLVADQMNQMDGIEGDIEGLMGATADMETRMDVVEQAFWGLFDGFGRLSYEVEKMQEDNGNKALIASLRSRIDFLERKDAEQDDQLAQRDICIKTLEETSYDGVLVWKISGMAQKRHDAISGKTTAIDSVCFFTSRTGYKMRAQVYLNGYGRGEDTHISVFFVMMKGEYDGILSWPFRQKVTFALLDQDRQEDLTDSFHAGDYPTSPSFTRPAGEANLPCGTPDFVPLEQVYNSGRAYVRDDTMFLKITVDTAGLH